MRRSCGLTISLLIVGATQLVSADLRVSAEAAAAPTWLPTTTIQVPVPWPAPDLGMNSGGRALVAWTDSQVGSFPFQASYRLAGAPNWPRPVQLARSKYSTPRVALDGKGNAVLVEPGESRSTNDGATARYYSAASGKWSPPAQLSLPGIQVQEIRVGMDESGNAVAVWLQTVGSTPVLASSYRPASSGRWLAPVALPSIPDAEPLSVELSVAADGSAAVAALVLNSSASPETTGVDVVVGANGNWGARTQVASYERGGYFVSAAAEPNGGALVSWDEYLAGNEVVRAASYTPGGGWGTAEDLSFRDGQACCAVLAADGVGSAVAVWDATVDVEASNRSPSGLWSRPVALSPSLHAGTISVASNASGEAIAAWQGASVTGGLVTGGLVQAAAYLPASGWEPATTLANAADVYCCPALSTGLDAAGDGAVVWDNHVSTGADGSALFSVQAALLDAEGPLLHATYPLKPPMITGTPHVGHKLTCRPGTWSGDQPITFAYHWLRNGRPAALGPRYQLRQSDAGHHFRCRVIATNSLGAATATSAKVVVRR
jgi:hypothetical protein